jgi:hypothetical protein
MLDTRWPPSVLAMPNCGEVRSPDGRLIFAGIRVRMGIFWAKPGSIVALVNPQSRTFTVRGPGMNGAVAVSEAAHGGQTILTREVWKLVQKTLPHAGFPIIHHLGTYSLPGEKYSGDLYEVCGHVYKRLERPFPPLQKALKTGSARSLICSVPDAFPRMLQAQTKRGTKAGALELGMTLVCCCMLLPELQSDDDNEVWCPSWTAVDSACETHSRLACFASLVVAQLHARSAFTRIQAKFDLRTAYRCIKTCLIPLCLSCLEAWISCPLTQTLQRQRLAKCSEHDRACLCAVGHFQWKQQDALSTQFALHPLHASLFGAYFRCMRILMIRLLLCFACNPASTTLQTDI